MLETLKQIDRQLFLLLNDINNGFFDVLMFWITEKYTWFPFYVLLAGFLIWKFQWRSILILISIGLVITACDQFTSSFMKPFFERFRPCHNPEIQNLVHVVGGCGGQYGFASSHAANTFGLAMFLWLLLRDWSRNVGYIFFWAAIVSYSRIYVGVHYPGDILIGSLVGIGFAWIIYQLYILTETKLN